MPPLSYCRSSVYTDNEKHFMKSCLNVFPVFSTCMIFFGLNSFSSLVSPEFSVTLCLQGTITSFFSASEKLKRAKPLPFPPTSIPPSVLCSSSIFHEWGCHQRAQYSRQGLIMVFYKTTWMLLLLHWEQVIRDILSLHLPFVVGSHWWQYLSWLAQWPSAFYPFPFPADKFPVFSANSRHESLNDLALHSTEVYRIVCFFGIVVSSAWYPHLLPYWWCLPSSCRQQISKGPSYY